MDSPSLLPNNLSYTPKKFGKDFVSKKRRRINMEDKILELYTLLYHSRIHNSNAFGTPEEAAKIKELIYCGSYQSAARAIGRIKGGRGGGQVKRNQAVKLLRALYVPNIIKVHLGSIYTLPDGRSSIAVALENFRAEHPNCEQFYGDMRRDKIPCKTVYRLYVYDSETRINTYRYVFIERS
jgi:hypothetical protein